MASLRTLLQIAQGHDAAAAQIMDAQLKQAQMAQAMQMAEADRQERAANRSESRQWAVSDRQDAMNYDDRVRQDTIAQRLNDALLQRQWNAQDTQQERAWNQADTTDDRAWQQQEWNRQNEITNGQENARYNRQIDLMKRQADIVEEKQLRGFDLSTLRDAYQPENIAKEFYGMVPNSEMLTPDKVKNMLQEYNSSMESRYGKIYPNEFKNLSSSTDAGRISNYIRMLKIQMDRNAALAMRAQQQAQSPGFVFQNYNGSGN